MQCVHVESALSVTTKEELLFPPAESHKCCESYIVIVWYSIETLLRKIRKMKDLQEQGVEVKEDEEQGVSEEQMQI